MFANRLKSKAVAVLLLRGANKDLKDKDGLTPLQLAVKAFEEKETRTLACLHSLLEFRVNVNSTDNDGFTALHWAIYNQKTKSAGVLMKSGADTMTLTTCGWTPLSSAIYWAITTSFDDNNPEKAADLQDLAVKMLKAPDFQAKHIDAVNDIEGTALYYATAYALPELVVLLLQRGARVYTKKGKLYPFQEEWLQTFLDNCISYESRGKKVSECILQFDYTFLTNSKDKEATSRIDYLEDNENRMKSELYTEEGDEPMIILESLNEKQKIDQNTSPKALFSPPPPPPPLPQEGIVLQKKKKTPETKPVPSSLSGTDNEVQISQDDVRSNAKPEVTVLEDLTAHHRNLLKHPLLRAFLMLKWRKINNIYKAWIAVKAIFLCLLLAAVARNFRTSDKTDKNEERLSNVTGTGNDIVVELNLDVSNYMLFVPLSLLLVTFIAVELLQFLISPHSWFLELKSWLQVTILVSTSLTLLAFWHIIPIREEMVRQTVAYLLPLAYYEFLHELGCHPRFSKYILLFKRISIKFAKYTSIYVGMVIMCAFSFNVMLDPKNNEEEKSLVPTILNTILKFIGEVEVPPLSEEFYTAQVAQVEFTKIPSIPLSGFVLRWIRLLHRDCLDELAKRAGSG